MPVMEPVYYVSITGSNGVEKHNFSSAGANDKRVNSISIKPGLTSTIGTFEVEFQDSTGSLQDTGVFKDITVFDDIKIYMGYDNTGSTPDMAGKIETIQSSLDSKGYVRIINGRDYGECLARILVNRALINQSGDTVIQTLRNK